MLITLRLQRESKGNMKNDFFLRLFLLLRALVGKSWELPLLIQADVKREKLNTFIFNPEKHISCSNLLCS